LVSEIEQPVKAEEVKADLQTAPGGQGALEAPGADRDIHGPCGPWQDLASGCDPQHKVAAQEAGGITQHNWRIRGFLPNGAVTF